MPNRNSGLAELAQMMQLVNGGGQDNAAAQQQHAGLQWMQMQQQQQQRAAEQELTRQHYGAMQQKQADLLQQQISADAWRQTHAEAQDKHLLAQEKVAEERLKQQLIMERDKEGVQLYHAAILAGKPHDFAVRFLSPARRASLDAQHQAQIAQTLPGVQSLVEGIYNSPDALRKGTDPNMLAMAAIASAGFRPQDYMDKIDYSGMNPWPGFVSSKSGASPVVESPEIQKALEENPDLARKMNEQQGREQILRENKQRKSADEEAKLRRWALERRLAPLPDPVPQF